MKDRGQVRQTTEIHENYRDVVRTLRQEFGVLRLASYQHGRQSWVEELANFTLEQEDIEKVLSGVELVLLFVVKHAEKDRTLYGMNAKEIATDAINEINHRFRQHAIGYEFSNGQIIRIDSQLVHSEVVKPALTLLQASEFKGAEDEFLNAHAHYRSGKTKEAMTAALQAFESTMKIICSKRQWSHEPGATAKKLLDVCLEQGLIPGIWQSHFSALRATLESGILTGRNKLSAHGQGSMPTSVPDHLAAYMLHLTASAIVFLVESDRQLP